MLLEVAFSWLMFRSLGRTSDDKACGDHCRMLLLAGGILVLGMALTIARFRQAMWYSVAVAALCLLAAAVRDS